MLLTTFRYDYENVDACGANLIMVCRQTYIANFNKIFKTNQTYMEPLLPGYVGTILKADGHSFEVTATDNYEYRDPIDGSLTKNQVQSLKIYICSSCLNKIYRFLLCSRIYSI